jgi:tetratricopeptide (TPR) repeat protein
MRLVRIVPALVLLAAAAAVLPAQGRDAIARLEEARRARPNNVAALRALGVAYYKAERFADARTVLDQARRIDPKDGVSALYAGMSAEALRDFTNAKAAYNSYLQVGRTRRVRDQITRRLVALQREEIIEAAKAAVANEATLSRTPGERRTVAVPPLRFSGPDAEVFAPLERGLAELIITDLAQSAQLTLVERDRMQALADEIQLGAGDRTDPATAARAGRLLQAGRLISGGIIQSGNQLTLTSSVVEVATSQVSAPAQVTNELDALFAAEKQLVFRIFEQLGVTLTPAERQLVDRTPTTSFAAFLDYSRGLVAADDGRFDDAARFFQNAQLLDPGFGAASARYQAAQSAALGAQVSSVSIEAGLQGSAEGQTVEAAAQGNTSSTGGLTETLRQTAQDVNPPTVSGASNETGSTGGTTTSRDATPSRDAPSETTGTSTPVPRTGTVILVLRRP